MNYLNKIRKITKDSIPLKVKEEINKVKIGIEYAASNGEYEYYKPTYLFTYLDEVIEYFKREGFQVELEKISVKDSYITFRDDYLIISWKG